MPVCCAQRETHCPAPAPGRRGVAARHVAAAGGGRRVQDWHPAAKVPHIIEACKAAGDYCAARGVDYSKLAIHFTLRQPRLPTTLVTSANPGRMASNVRAVYEVLSEAEEACLAEVLEKFFPWRDTVGGRRCKSGTSTAVGGCLVGLNLVFGASAASAAAACCCCRVGDRGTGQVDLVWDRAGQVLAEGRDGARAAAALSGRQRREGVPRCQDSPGLRQLLLS